MLSLFGGKSAALWSARYVILTGVVKDFA